VGKPQGLHVLPRRLLGRVFDSIVATVPLDQRRRHEQLEIN
jgi:hypothetical protein